MLREIIILTTANTEKHSAVPPLCSLWLIKKLNSIVAVKECDATNDDKNYGRLLHKPHPPTPSPLGEGAVLQFNARLYIFHCNKKIILNK